MTKNISREALYELVRKLPCQVDNLKLEISLKNFLGMICTGVTPPRDSCGLNSLFMSPNGFVTDLNLQ
jgi:hypothetical protein